MFIHLNIYVYIYIPHDHMCIYIYVWYPPRPTFQANLVVFTVFFLTFWTLKLRAFFGDQKLQIFASLFPSHPSLSTWDPRFKIHNPQTTSWIQGGRIQDSRVKIQDPKKTSWIQGGQDSRFKIPKRLLEPKGVGFKIQDQEDRIQDSRFKIPKRLLES